MKRKQMIAILLIAIAFLLGGILLSLDGNDAVTAASEKNDSLLAADQINVSFQQVGGKVVSVAVQEGQSVKKGDVLMQVDPTDIDLSIEKTKAQIAAMDIQINQAGIAAGDQDVSRQEEAVAMAKETLDYVQKNYDRIKSLYDEGAVTQATMDDTQLKLTTAKNALLQNQEALSKIKGAYENAQLNIPALQKQKEMLVLQLTTLEEQKARLTLKAPADGSIVKVVVKEGENIGAGSPAVLLQSSELYFDLYVPETEVGDFSVGKTVSVNVIALDQDFSGQVRSINSAPQYTSLKMSRDNGKGDLSVFLVRIYLEGDLKELLPGMTVEVQNGTDKR